jgi:hypothetical protein
VAVDDLYRVQQTCVMGLPSQLAVWWNNSIVFRGKTGGTSAQGLTDLWVSTIVPRWRQLIGPHTQINNVFTQTMTSTDYDYGGASVQLYGLASGLAALPPQCVAVMYWYPPEPYTRRRRGRIFISGLMLTHALDEYGFWRGDNLARLVSLGTLLMSTFGPAGSSDYELGVYSQLNGGVDPPWQVSAFTPSADFLVSLTICTRGTRRQRRTLH